METNLELPEGFEVEYSPNQIPEGFELEETPQLNNEMLYGRIGKPTYISAYKAPNVIDGLKNAWDFVTQVPYAAFMEQKKDNEAAELRTKGMMLRRIGQDLSEEEKARIQELDNPYSLGKYNQANNYGIYSKFVLDSNGEYFDKGSPAVIPERMGNGIKTLYAEVSKQTAIMYAIAKDAGIAATLGGLAGMGIGAITGAISTKTPQGAMAGAKTGFEGGAKLLARTAVAKKSFDLEAGFMRQELEELNNEFIANGTEPLTDREMDDLATSVGLINAGLEYWGLGAILKSIPNGQKVLDMFGKQGIKELAKDATFREQFKVIAADLTKAGISEGSTEMLQETTNFVYGNIARKIRNVAPRPLADKMDEIVQAGLVGAISAITMGGIGTAAQVTTVKIKQGIKPEVAKQEAEAMTIDERNEFINENIDTLAEAANEEADNILKGGVTYNRYKNELIKQGADEQQADNSAQLIEQAYRVIADKFGNEGIEHLKNANLQVIINNNNAKQIQAEEEILDTIMSEEEKSDKLMQFSVDELKTDAKTFQYKGNSNTEGVLAENGLEGVEKWDNKVSGKVFVYENKNGERFIADGHQRLGLAKRLKDPNIKLDGYLFREADGFTPAQVRTLAAYKNIGEKSGTALDAAKIIKEVGLEKLPKTIPMNSTLFKDGVSLSRLGDVAFEKVVNEEIPMNYAARVADAIRNNEEKQAAAIDLIRKYYIEGRVPNAERAFNIACDINSAPTNVVEQINLFGTQELTELLYVEKSEIVDRAVKDLQTNKKLFLKASKNKGKLESKGKTKIDKAASEMTAREAAIAADIIQHRAYVAGDISDKANELAQKVKDGELKVAEAVKEFEDFVLTPKILKEITGYTRKTIKLNQAAIDKAENISDLLTEDEAGTITPLEFYQKGFYQAAYKGSASNHDIESTDYIGSGEGNLAHGWGLYYAENKEVGENYRMGLVDHNKSTKYKYDGKSIEQTKFKDIEKDNLSFIKSLGKDKAIEFIKEEIEYTIKWGEDNKNIQRKELLEGNNRYLEKLKKELELAQELDPEKLVMSEGQLYKVDIPENDVLLDEQKTFEEQPKKVQEALKKIANGNIETVWLKDEMWQNSFKNILENNLTGKDIYDKLARYDKESASKLLNNYGIKGITYNGQQDGRCYVVFDDKAVKILQKYYQSNTKNLLMTHGARVERLDDILESGSLVAPSMAITKKGEKSLNFGGVVFVRDPKKINFSEDNIYDRDIYSPRLPQADYKTADGYFVSSYDYESMERLWNNDPERFKKNYSGKTFEEYFKGAKKVINLGFTPSGNRRTQPYNNKNLLNYIKKESLLAGENWDYGLSSLLAKLAKKQGTMEDLKKTAKTDLKNTSEELSKQWEEIKNDYEELQKKIEPYYSNEYVYLFEVMSDVVYSIEKNNKRKLSEYFNAPLPKEVVNEVKDFVKKAQKVPRAYFEAKPMKEVPLSDFAAVLVPEEVTLEQRKKLADYGLEIVDYKNGTLDEALSKLQQDQIYFQDQEGEKAPRGQFRIDENGSAIIDILQNGDASTIVHELGHFYLYSVEQLAQKNKRAEKEFNDILEHYGFTAEDLKDYDKLTDLHEKFARGFEAYLLEGSAPTRKMLKVFKNFKLWLRDIYNSVKDLDVDFSEASQKLFDRIFTTDEEYEKEVLPKYQYNYKKVLEIEQAKNEPEYKIKEALNNGKTFISTWYDRLFLPIDTRLGKLAPELKQKLRNHTAALAAITGKDLKTTTVFLNAVSEIKKQSPEDYYKLDLALKNRDSLTVNMVCEKYNLKKDFEAVRDILDDIYTEALEVGLDVGYLENYYPRQVKRDLTDKFIEYIEALERKEQLDIANQVLKFEDAKISLVLREMKEANNSQFWTQEDKAKFLNNRIRGFGQNNILLGRNGSLKYDRSIDELDGNFNQFYEPMEVSLVNYISSSRKTIEARKFFGGEDREVGKLRARIKRKKATLAEVQDRTPYQAKLKEENRIKYELSPLEIKLEALEKQDYIDNTEYKEKLAKKVERLKSQLEWTEQANPFQVKGVVIKRLKDEIYEAAKQIKDIIGDEENIEDSIGQLVAKLAQNGDIIAKDEREIREMLVARFAAKSMSDPARLLRDTTYIATLNDITNAITQFGDLAFSVYKFGFENTYKGLMKPFEIRKEDLGLNDLAYEFSNPTLLSKWIKKQFDFIGLSRIDGLGKNTYIQASILDAQKQIKKNNAVFDEKLKALFGDNIEEVKQDLLEGKTTDNTIIFTFNELADIQPISEDQTPELYNNGGSFMRLFYTLKTYGIKALDVARNDITMKIEEGIRTKNKKLAKEGLKNLVRLQMLLWLFGVPNDALKDLLSNRDFNLFETMIDNLIPAFLVNRYMFRTAGREGVGAAVVSFFSPACVNVIENTGKSYAISNIPLIGKPLYNWGIKEKK